MQNAIAIETITNLTMSSREIAELTEKRHDNVKRTIETLANNGVIRLPQIEDSVKINNLGLPQTTKVYVFSGEQGKRDSIVVVAQLSPEFTARLVDRWQELEEQASKPQFVLPKTYLEALKALVVTTEEVMALENKVKEDEPKVEFFDAYVDNQLCETLTESWKSLGLKPNKFSKFLGEQGVLTKRGSSAWLPKQEYINREYFKVKVNEYGGQTYVTHKGKTWIAEKYAALFLSQM